MSGRSVEIEGVRHKAPIPMAATRGPLLCTSAVMGIDPVTGIEPDQSAEEIRQAFSNLRQTLLKAGFSTADIVHVGVLLASDEHREEVNAEWIKLFPEPEDRPARHTTITSFRGKRVVQLEAICYQVAAQT